MGIKDIKNSVLRIKGAGTGESIDVRIGDGNISWTEQIQINYKLDRGNLYAVQDGDDVPLELSFEGLWENTISESGEDITPYEALTRTGNAAAWTSVDADTCAPYAVDIEIITGTDCSSGNKREKFTFPDFRCLNISPDLRDGKIAFSGSCNVTRPTIDRIDDSSTY